MRKFDCDRIEKEVREITDKIDAGYLIDIAVKTAIDTRHEIGISDTVPFDPSGLVRLAVACYRAPEYEIIEGIRGVK